MTLDVSKFYDPTLAGGDVLPGAPFEPWQLRILTAAELGALSAVERLGYLACWALLAPTSHNTVPQRFELRPEDGAIGLWIDRGAVLAESDPAGRQATISLGCAIENLLVAANARGLGSYPSTGDWIDQNFVGPVLGLTEKERPVACIFLGYSEQKTLAKRLPVERHTIWYTE